MQSFLQYRKQSKSKNVLTQEPIPLTMSEWNKFWRWIPQARQPRQTYLLFIVLFTISYRKQKKKSNYLNSHGEEAQEKPPG